MSVTEFDPVDLAVLSNRFRAIVRSMANTLERSSRSVIINTGRDFSCCVITSNDELMAVAESLPIHVLSGPDVMSRSMKKFHADLRPGDAFLHNSPYHGNTHPADLSVLVPVFDDDGRHRFTVLSKAHQADIGNSEPTTYSAMSRDVYEEGALIFPCVQVQRDYADIEDIIRMCQVRIRVPEKWWGDYLGLVGSARIGERNIRLLAAEVGWDKLDLFTNAWFDYSEQRMADALSVFPNGSVEVHTSHDPFERAPEGVPLTVKITVNDARVTIDLRDNPDCLPFGLNLCEATSNSAAMLGILNALHADVPANAGAYRRINILLRENCVVGIPRHPASCSVSTTNLMDRVANAVQRGFAELAEGFGMAEVGLSFPASVSVVSGRDPRHENRPFIDQIMLAWTGGPGGPHADGWLTFAGVGDSGVIMRDSIEVDELRFPVRIDVQRLIADTEGPGTYRGAPSAEMEMTIVDSEVEFMYNSDGTIFPALGAAGGGAGGTAWQGVRKRDGSVEPKGTCARVMVRSGETLLSRCCGGGGYGEPRLRNPERVAFDVREGYVTVGRAHEIYGVVVTANGHVDVQATTVLRSLDLSISRSLEVSPKTGTTSYEMRKSDREI
jgi:N-methylhydantoinase B